MITVNELNTFRSRDLTIYSFWLVAIQQRISSKNMPPKKSTWTQLCVTDIHQSDDTLEAAASTAECTTPTVLHEDEIDYDNDLHNGLNNHPGGWRDEESQINNPSGDLRSQMPMRIG